MNDLGCGVVGEVEEARKLGVDVDTSGRSIRSQS